MWLVILGCINEIELTSLDLVLRSFMSSYNFKGQLQTFQNNSASVLTYKQSYG